MSICCSGSFENIFAQVRFVRVVQRAYRTTHRLMLNKIVAFVSHLNKNVYRLPKQCFNQRFTHVTKIHTIILKLLRNTIILWRCFYIFTCSSYIIYHVFYTSTSWYTRKYSYSFEKIDRSSISQV